MTEKGIEQEEIIGDDKSAEQTTERAKKDQEREPVSSTHLGTVFCVAALKFGLDLYLSRYKVYIKLFARLADSPFFAR